MLEDRHFEPTDGSAQARPLRVLNVGPHLESHGGMANNQLRVLRAMPSEVRVIHVGTVLSQWGRSRIGNSVRFGGALATVTWRLVWDRPDVVHIRMSQGGSSFRKAMVVLLSKIFRKPVVLHAHGWGFHEFFEKLPCGLRWPLTRLLRKADLLVVLGTSWRDYYCATLGIPKEKSLVLANPVDIPDPAPSRSESDEVILTFLGRVGQRKGAFVLIRAFARLPAEIRDRARLMLAGDGELDEAARLLEVTGCGDRVTVLGWIDADEGARLLQRTNVFVLPTQNEGMPLALLEAMSWGLACVSTAVGGIPDLVEDRVNGILVPPDDPEALSAALAKLITDPSERQRLGAAARATAEECDTRLYVRKLVSIYRSLADAYSGERSGAEASNPVREA